jgi:RimJ/RimL family protein N-acetyltransferase
MLADDTPRHRPLSAEVEVRPARPEDAALLHLWRAEKSVRRYQPLAPLSTSQLRSELASRRADDLWRNRGDRFDWIVLVHRQPAGWITLVVHSWEHGLAECGYSLSTAFQGRGLMHKALTRLIGDLFARTRLHRLEARTALANVASQKVLEKLGFRREGTLRGYFQLDGEWVDNYLFAIVKEDWLLLQRARRGDGAGA